MGWIIFVAFVSLIAIAFIMLARTGVIRVTRRDPATGERVRHVYERGPIEGAIIVWLLVVALGTVVASYNQIGVGHVGLEYQFGNIIGQTGAGAHFILPWRSLEEVNVQVQRARFHNPGRTAAGKEEALNVDVYGTISAASHETQDVYYDVTLNWFVTPDRVQSLYATVGPNFFNTLVPSRVNQYFKAETVKYEATEATQKRETIREDVAKALESDLAPYGITVASLQIDNISYDKAFSDAILQKQVATQNAQTAQNQVAVEQANAAQAVARAKGVADAAIESARGDAQSTLLRADAQAQANQKIAASLTPELIRSQAIARWGGNMPAILPSGGSVIIDPASLFAAR